MAVEKQPTGKNAPALELSYSSPTLTKFDDAVLVGDLAFGELGRQTAMLWGAYNQKYFCGELTPCPILYVPTSPYGRWEGLCCYHTQRRIYLMFPSGKKRPWGAVRGVLLHEMAHQYLMQCGRNPSHASQDWCDEIMRISRSHFGKMFWAGKYTVGKQKTRKGAWESIRINKAGAKDEQSISMLDIAQWPHSVGIMPPDISVKARTPRAFDRG